MNILKRFVKETEGQDLIEYGLLLGLITVGVITIVTTLGGYITNLYSTVSTTVATIPGT